jgi:hypothetical protein
MTTESRVGAYLFILAMVVQPAYVAYRLWGILAGNAPLPENVTVAQFGVIGGLFLVARVLLIVFAVRLVLRFGRGLKEKLINYSKLHLAGDVDVDHSNLRFSHDEQSLYNEALEEGSPGPRLSHPAKPTPQVPSTQY